MDDQTRKVLQNIESNRRIDNHIEFQNQVISFNQKSFKQETEYKDRENEIVKMQLSFRNYENLYEFIGM